MQLPLLDRLILGAQKPSRYAGGELNAVRKRLDQVALKWGLAFPDTYEVGMSNVGFRLLYHALNEREGVACERFFMPWPDMESALRAERLPLFSIESRAPAAAFDVLGFTLQFELCYTTVLAMLDLCGIALHSKDRKRDDPLVLGGGPCTYNPEPVADFFDAFVIGEGEEVVHEISDAVAGWKDSGAPRDHLLWLLAEIPGVYVPSLFRVHYAPDRTIARYEALKPGYESIVRRVIPDLNLVPQAEKPIVPFMQTVHDRLPLEIQRGCTRGCRFCQVGMITRPTRQRDPNQVRRIAEQGLEVTGYEEVGFLSLSAGDYSCIDGVLEDFFDELGPENIGISLPSLRTETMSPRLAAQIKRVRKSGFTVAPEAATERMRRVINKGNAEKDLLHAVKPFTPFQWEPMIPLEETQRKQALLRDELRKLGRGYRDLHVKPHDARQGALEGALALGDRRLATAVLHAFRRGQRLDGWTEHFRLEVWQEAFAEAEREHGVGMHFFAHREKGEREVLPFDHIDCEVTKPYLWKARMAARSEGQVPDCAYGEEICTACGACDYEVVDNIVYHPEDYRRQPAREPPPIPSERTLLRLRYAKEGVAVALSHLETMTALLRTFRRAKLSIPHSQGFHPKPKVSFGPACPVGTESQAEYLDLELFGVQDAAQVATEVRARLPEGFRLLGCEALAPGGESLNRIIRGIHYRVELPEDAPDAAVRLAQFASSGESIVLREREGKRPVRVDLKRSVDGLVADGPRRVRFTLRAGEPDAVARPSELLSALFGEDVVRPGVSRLIREGVVFGPPAA